MAVDSAPLESLRQDRVIAVVRGSRVADPAGLAQTFVANGIRCVEYTFTIPDILPAIRASTDGGALVGAGTVLVPEQARQAIDAGARFVVTPTVRPDVVDTCLDLDVPVILGAFSPTEVRTAVEVGAAAIKLFPARVGGPEYIRDLLAPFPELSLIPSGGVGPENLRSYLDAGALAVYIGTSLAPPYAVESGNLREIARRAALIRAALQTPA